MSDPLMLPAVDEDPDNWGPDHDQLVGEVLAESVLEELITEGNRQGYVIDRDDDWDNGLGHEPV